jgi:hypothetical protein
VYRPPSPVGAGATRVALPTVSPDQVVRGDRVEYVGSPLGGGDVAPGAIGRVTNVNADTAFVVWPGPHLRAVPVGDVRVVGPEVIRVVGETPNRSVWGLLGDELPPKANGRPRDPYLEQGAHPDVVSRIWTELGKALPRDCRGQAKGKPVLAHPDTDRIVAVAHGTAYALWLTPEDIPNARERGAQTVMTWSGGSTTDLAQFAGAGWIWGRWYEEEPQWLRHAYEAAGHP